MRDRLKARIRYLETKVIHLEAVLRVVKDKVRVPPPRFDPTYRIKQIVAKGCGVRVARLVDGTHERESVWPRHLAMYFCQLFQVASTKEIVWCFGLADHSSVSHASKSIRKRIRSSKWAKTYRSCLKEIEKFYEHKRQVRSVRHEQAA